MHNPSGRDSPSQRSNAAQHRRMRDENKKQKAKHKFKKNFAERMLGAYGFGEEHFKKGGFVKGKLGLFAEAINYDQEKDAGSAPIMEPAKVMRDNPNPNISTIINLLDSLVKTANRVGIITSAQQQALQDQISKAARDAEEQAMEGGSPASMANGPDLTPLNHGIETLTEKLKPLGEVVDEKLKEQAEDNRSRGFMQRFAESYGLGDVYEDRTRRKAADKKRLRAERTRARGGRRYRSSASQQREMRTESLRREARIANPSRLARATRSAGTGLLNMTKKATGAVGRVASKIGGVGAISGVGALSKNIASILGKGVKGASVADTATKKIGGSTIKRIVGPIIKKALGSTVLKSIPILGAAVGGLFAAKKLLEGDPVGAGLEAASGLGGPLTAIPAMAASVSRDAYSSIYNVQPERDPLFGPRMKLITGIVGGMITALLASKIEKKDTPTRSEVDRATIPKKPPAQQQRGETATGAPRIPPATAAPTVTAQSSTAAPATAAPATAQAPQAAATPAPSGGRSGGRSGEGASRSPSPSTSGSADGDMATPPPQAPSMVPSTPTAGVDLAQMTSEVDAAANRPTITNLGSNGQRVLPATTPTTKSGVSGAGDVPDPNYYGLGNIAPQIYFNTAMS